jgi:hypothetical protein
MIASTRKFLALHILNTKNEKLGSNKSVIITAGIQVRGA